MARFAEPHVIREYRAASPEQKCHAFDLVREQSVRDCMRAPLRLVLSFA